MTTIFLALYGLLFSLFPRPNPTYLVTQVIDGDTFVVDNLFYVRLTNIDAPEKNDCLGQESTQYLTKLIKDKRVRLTSSAPSPDGRVLAQAYLGYQYINLEMVKAGLAQYTSGNYDQSDVIEKLNAKNKLEKVGVFNEKCLQTVNPENPQCNIKGNLKEKHKIYTMPGCKSYNFTEMRPDEGDRWFCSESAARSAGFTKAQNCH